MLASPLNRLPTTLKVGHGLIPHFPYVMSLSALPDDILLEITKWVATDDYIPTYETVDYPYIPFSARRRTKFLGSLALCSRRLNRMASPILYKTFVQTRERALPAFLRLLSSRPERGAYVTKFVVSAYNAAEERFYRRDMLDFPRLDLVTLGVELELLDYFQLKRPELDHKSGKRRLERGCGAPASAPPSFERSRHCTL